MTHHQQAGREKLTKIDREGLQRIADDHEALGFCVFPVFMYSTMREWCGAGLIRLHPTEPKAYITPLGRRTLSEAQT